MKPTLMLIASIVLTIVLGMPTNFVAAQATDVQKQPRMTSALEHLQAAEKELEAATHDKGGHRAKALALTRQAITHVKEGIAFDDTHKTGAEKKPKAK